MTKHYNLTDHRQEEKSNKPRRRRRPPSKEWIRQKAKESSEGGRGCCYHCNEYFSMTHLRLKKVSIFSEDWVCLDCIEERGL